MAPQSWCVRALLCLLAPIIACNGEDELGPRIPASIVVVPNEPRVPLSQTKQLTATVVDAAGRAIEGQPLSFITDNPEIMTVSATGLLTAGATLGEARISVASGELTAGVTALAVLPPNAIVVQPAELLLQPPQGAYLYVTVTNELSEPVPATVTYTTSNGNVATVDAFGFVTARQKGTATVTVSAPDREAVEVPVVVDQVPTAIQVTPTSVALQPGGLQPLTVQVLDAFGSAIPNPTVAFSSDAPDVASVSIGGLVRGVAEGSATISVASGGLTATVGVFVGDAPPGLILQHVPLDGGPWGVRVRGDRYFLVGHVGMLYVGQGTGFGFSQTIGINGLTLDVDADNANIRAYVASALDDQGLEGIAVVDLGSGAVIDHLRGTGTNNLYAVALSPDEEHLFVGTGSTVERINLSTREVTVVSGVTGSVTTLSRHPTEPRLYGNMGYTSVVEIDSQNGNVLRTFNQPASQFGIVQSTAVAPDGTRLYAALESGDLLSWDLDTGALGPRLTNGGGFGLAVSPDGKVLYAARGADVLMVDRASLVLLKTVPVGGFVRRIGVRPDGVAVVANDNGWVDFIK
jgi:uncharacterized protein YjdB